MARDREPLWWPTPTASSSRASICLASRIEALAWPTTCWLIYRYAGKRVAAREDLDLEAVGGACESWLLPLLVMPSQGVEE
jgi:hypothetical protein